MKLKIICKEKVKTAPTRTYLNWFLSSLWAARVFFPSWKKAVIIRLITVIPKIIIPGPTAAVEDSPLGASLVIFEITKGLRLTRDTKIIEGNMTDLYFFENKNSGFGKTWNSWNKKNEYHTAKNITPRSAHK